MLVEVTLISFGMTFRLQGIPQRGGLVLVVLGTIWAIGASMIALSLLQFLGRGNWPLARHHDRRRAQPARRHLAGDRPAGHPLLPWIGAMLIGFGSAAVFELPAERRNPLLRRAGFAMCAAFLVLRALDVCGDPNARQAQPSGVVATVMDFLNTTKYPPSLLFVLMTFGPAAVLCSYADRITQGPLARVKNTMPSTSESVATSRLPASGRLCRIHSSSSTSAPVR